MWTKTKQIMEKRLAESLKGRVTYNYSQRTTKHHGSVMKAFHIHVDKKTWYATNLQAYTAIQCAHDELIENLDDDRGYWQKYNATEDEGESIALKREGLVDEYTVPRYLHEYLNVCSIDDCMSGKNYFLYMLGILDHRTGKRRIEKMFRNIYSEPEWIRKFILLRAGAEGLIVTE